MHRFSVVDRCDRARKVILTPWLPPFQSTPGSIRRSTFCSSENARVSAGFTGGSTQLEYAGHWKRPKLVRWIFMARFIMSIERRYNVGRVAFYMSCCSKQRRDCESAVFDNQVGQSTWCAWCAFWQWAKMFAITFSFTVWLHDNCCNNLCFVRNTILLYIANIYLFWRRMQLNWFVYYSLTICFAKTKEVLAYTWIHNNYVHRLLYI